MIENLQQTIINFCVENIKEEMIFFLITAVILFTGYEEGWVNIEKVWKIIGVISSIFLFILLIIYLVPLTIPSLKNIF